MILFSFVHSHSFSLNLSQSFIWSNEFRAKNKQSYNPAPMQCGWSVLFQKWKWRLGDSFSLTSFIHFSHVFICLFICIFGLAIILVEVALELLFWNLTGFFQSNKFLCMVFNSNDLPKSNISDTICGSFFLMLLNISLVFGDGYWELKCIVELPFTN